MLAHRAAEFFSPSPWSHPGWRVLEAADEGRRHQSGLPASSMDLIQDQFGEEAVSSPCAPARARLEAEMRILAGSACSGRG